MSGAASVAWRIYAYLPLEGGYGQALAAGLEAAWRDLPQLRCTITDGSRAGRPGWWQRGDGYLVVPDHQGAADLLRVQKQPIILLSRRYPDLPQPVISADRVAGGRLAASYFIERGFRSFLYCGRAGDTDDERLQGFRQAIAAASLPPPAVCLRQDDLAARLGGLPRPLAVFAAVDSLAGSVQQACQELDIAVPSEVAVLGMDDCRAYCETQQPPLASIATNGERIAAEGLRALLAWLAGRPPNWRRRLVPPRGVVERDSAGSLAVSDPLVAGALQLLRQHVREPLGVAELADRLHVARRTLEVRFRRSLGSSVYATGLALRLDRARSLLADPGSSIAAVARATGFQGPSQFHVAFRRRFGCTPRQAHRACSAD